MSAIRKRMIVAVARVQIRPKTREDTGSVETRTAVFDEKTPVGIIFDLATPFRDSPNVEISIYEDEQTAVAKPSWIEQVALNRNAPLPRNDDDVNRSARLAFGRQLYFWPPRNDEEVTDALKEYAEIQKAAKVGQWSYLEGVKPELKNLYYSAAAKFLEQPIPTLESEDLF